MASVLYAWSRGGRPERVTAVAFLVASIVVTISSTTAWRYVQVMPTFVEACLLALLLWVALTADRWWPMFAVSFQLIESCAKAAPLFDPMTRPYAAYFGVVGWDYLTLAALAIGTFVEAESAYKVGVA